MISLIAHIPHSSIYVPPDVRDSLTLTDPKLRQEILRFTDWYVDELFSCVHEMGGKMVDWKKGRTPGLRPSACSGGMN